MAPDKDSSEAVGSKEADDRRSALLRYKKSLGLYLYSRLAAKLAAMPKVTRPRTTSQRFSAFNPRPKKVLSEMPELPRDENSKVWDSILMAPPAKQLPVELIVPASTLLIENRIVEVGSTEIVTDPQTKKTKETKVQIDGQDYLDNTQKSHTTWAKGSVMTQVFPTKMSVWFSGTIGPQRTGDESYIISSQTGGIFTVRPRNAQEEWFLSFYLRYAKCDVPRDAHLIAINYGETEDSNEVTVLEMDNVEWISTSTVA